MNMKHQVMTTYMAVALACGTRATAATVEVQSVAELTDAVARANAGETVGGEPIDTIRLMKSGSPYTFTSELMMDSAGGNLIAVGNISLTIEGEDNSSRKTWTEGAEPVIIDGNSLGRIINFTANKSGMVRNICFTRAMKSEGGAVKSATPGGVVSATNCVFRQNSANNGNSAAVMWVELRDCLVKDSTGGTAVRGGDASQTLRAYGCDFVHNEKGVATYTFAAEGCSFVGNTNATAEAVNGYMVATNCTFIGNSGTYIASGSSFVNCEFSNNVCTGNAPSNPGGVLFNPGEVRGCRFIDNYSAQNCCAIFHKNDAEMVVADSTFLRNVSAGNYCAGVAIFSQPTTVSCTMTVTNCTFEGNAATGGNALCGTIGVGVFANPVPQSARPMWELATVIDSTFTTNYASTAAGVHSVRAVNCTFDGNRRANGTQSECDAARNCRFERCDFNTANFNVCTFDRCRIHDATNNAIALFRGYTRITNSIIEKCSLFGDASLYHFSSSYKDMDAEFVNCTIVSNVMRTYAPNASFSPLVGIKFKNCLLYGNDTGYGKYDVSATSESEQHAYLSFENTYAEVVSDQNGKAYNISAEYITQFTSGQNSLGECKNPKFVGMDANVRERYPDEPHWALSFKSPLVGKGDSLDFTDDDLDLAGRPRLRDGKIDVGCYQCWLNPLGLTLIFR